MNVEDFKSVFDEIRGLSIVDIQIDLSGGIQSIQLIIDGDYMVRIDSYTHPMVGINGIVMTDVSLYQKTGLYGTYSLIKKYDDSEQDEVNELEGDNE